MYNVKLWLESGLGMGLNGSDICISVSDRNSNIKIGI